MDSEILKLKVKNYTISKTRESCNDGPLVRAQLTNRHRKDLLAESICRNRSKHGLRGKLQEAELKSEREREERLDKRVAGIEFNFRQTIGSLYPSFVTYKMTNSEIAGKAHKMA